MKKDKTKYRYTRISNGTLHYQMLDAKALFQQQVRQQWDQMTTTPYQVKCLDVEQNLAETDKDP